MPANAGCPAKYAVRFRGSVSRRGVAAAAAMEDANGDLTGRKVLYLDSTTTAGFVGIDEPSGSACYKRSTSWRCNPVIVSAQLAGRRCAIVRQRLRDASTGTVRSFSPSHDEADHNLPSPQPYSFPARAIGEAGEVSGGPNSSPDRRLSKHPFLTRLILSLRAGQSAGLPLQCGIPGNVDGKDAEQLWIAGRRKVRQNFAHDPGIST